MCQFLELPVSGLHLNFLKYSAVMVRANFNDFIQPKTHLLNSEFDRGSDAIDKAAGTVSQF